MKGCALPVCEPTRNYFVPFASCPHVLADRIEKHFSFCSGHAGKISDLLQYLVGGHLRRVFCRLFYFTRHVKSLSKCAPSRTQYYGGHRSITRVLCRSVNLI